MLIQSKSGFFWSRIFVLSAVNLLNGPIYSFTTRFLPDIHVPTVQVPTSAYSGQNFSISWEVNKLDAKPFGKPPPPAPNLGVQL